MSERRGAAEAALETCLEAIERRDSEIHAFWRLDREGARRAAQASDRRRAESGALSPIDGWCVAIKDNIDVAGLPTTAGIAGPAPPAERDAPVVALLREAGAVLLGKTAMDEGAFGGSTDNPHFGRTHNPHRIGLSAGGSSGGSGAAVAARFCRAALGTDTSGSVRIPASYCGVVGLKPTRGTLSTAGIMPLSFTLDHVGVLARTVADTAAVWSVVAAGSRDPAPRSLAFRGPCSLAGKLLGIPDVLARTRLEPEARDGFERALDKLRRMGAAVTEVAVAGWDPPHTRLGGLLVVEAEAALVHARALDAEDPALSPGFRTYLRYGRDCSARRLTSAYAHLAEVAAGAGAALAAVDALVMPTTPQPAFSFDAPAPEDQAILTGLANISGHPAISLPMGMTADGLPLGFQLMGRYLEDAALLELAAAVAAALV